MYRRNLLRKAAGVILCCSMTFSMACTSLAALDSGVKPVVDEAYYVTTDYYGNPTEAGVVKSYDLNGATEIVDHGTYDAVSNLTNAVQPVIGGGEVSFDFGETAPSRFYFEGKTTKPFEELPWTVSLTYRLNGKTVNAEELAGQKGVAEITVKAVPNPKASDYAKNNWFLAAAAMFNQDDIISLESDDAQIMTIGNIRAAALTWLPGEERTSTIRIGADSFEFDGMTFTMSPVNASGRLKDLTDLRKDKEDIQDSWDNMNTAMDQVLDSMDAMKENLNGAADGFADLNQVRENVHSHQSAFYGDLDSFLGNMDGLSAALTPLSGHVNSADNTVTDLRQNLTDLNTALQNTKTHLEETRSTLRSLKKDMQNLQDVTSDLDHDTHHVKGDIEDLQELQQSGAKSIGGSITGTLTQMGQLYKAYAAYMKANGMEPVDAVGDGRVLYDLDTEGVGMASPSDAGIALGYDGEGSFDITGMSYPEGSFQDFAIEKMESLGYDEDEISYAVALWDYRQEVQDAYGTAGTAYNAADSLASDLLDVELEELYDLMYGFGVDGELGLGQADTITADINEALGKIDTIHTTLDNYIPELQQALADTSKVCDTMSGTMTSMSKFLRTSRNIIRNNSDRLNDGMKDTLDNSTTLLRKTAGMLDSTEKLREAKKSITDLVDDKWDENTGEKTNVFKIDAEAAAQSLTSPDNGEVNSVSVMIRSAEIKIEDNKTHLSSGDDSDHRTILQRIGQMFKDLWNSLTGWMKK